MVAVWVVPFGERCSLRSCGRMNAFPTRLTVPKNSITNGLPGSSWSSRSAPTWRIRAWSITAIRSATRTRRVAPAGGSTTRVTMTSAPLLHALAARSVQPHRRPAPISARVSDPMLLDDESEAIFAQQHGLQVSYVIPPQTILIQTPAAVTTNSHDPTEAANFLNYLWTPPGTDRLRPARVPAGRAMRRHGVRLEVPAAAEALHDHALRRLERCEHDVLRPVQGHRRQGPAVGRIPLAATASGRPAGRATRAVGPAMPAARPSRVRMHVDRRTVAGSRPSRIGASK